MNNTFLPHWTLCINKHKNNSRNVFYGLNGFSLSVAKLMIFLWRSIFCCSNIIYFLNRDWKISDFEYVRFKAPNRKRVKAVLLVWCAFLLLHGFLYIPKLFVNWKFIFLGSKTQALIWENCKMQISNLSKEYQGGPKAGIPPSTRHMCVASFTIKCFRSSHFDLRLRRNPS